MTEILRTGRSVLAPTQLKPQDVELQPGRQEPKKQRADQVQISNVAPKVDFERQSLKMAQELANRTLAGIEAAQQGVAQVADRWRQGPASADQLREPASKVLEAAGTTYKGIQPLMTDQELQIGPHKVKGFELVGENGLVPMDALLPGDSAPQAINKAWSQLQAARELAGEQRDKLDQALGSPVQGAQKPQSVEVGAGLHQLPAQRRILELLR